MYWKLKLPTSNGMTNFYSYFQDIGAWPKESRAFWRAYAVGFLLSLLCTAMAFYLATSGTLSYGQTALFLCALAFAQLIIQLVCFLHLGGHGESRGRLLVFGFAVLIAAITIAGSLWIIFSLNARMMPDMQTMEHYMGEQGGF